MFFPPSTVCMTGSKSGVIHRLSSRLDETRLVRKRTRSAFLLARFPRCEGLLRQGLGRNTRKGKIRTYLEDGERQKENKNQRAKKSYKYSINRIGNNNSSSCAAKRTTNQPITACATKKYSGKSPHPRVLLCFSKNAMTKARF